MEKFCYHTSDYVTIMGVQNQPKEVKKVFLALHMMPATKESWAPLMVKFEALGWLVYAIDFRGHGESTSEGKLNWQKFDAEQHKEYKIDAYQAVQKIEHTHKVDGIIGASIGANVALQLQVDCGTAVTVLLSPGLNYWGLETLPAAEKLEPDQACLILTSHEVNQKGEKLDEQAQQIFATLPTEHKAIEVYDGQAHGTNLLDESPDRLDKIIDFLAQALDQGPKK